MTRKVPRPKQQPRAGEVLRRLTNIQLVRKNKITSSAQNRNSPDAESNPGPPKFEEIESVFTCNFQWAGIAQSV
jgi:hypothetical protein